MKKTRLIAVLLVTAVFVGITATSVIAEESKGEKGEWKQWEKRGHHSKIEEMIYKKARFLFMNKDEIGLTDEQVEKIKDITLETKKNLIRQDAEIEIITLDIMAKMREETIDVEAVNRLLDQKYELKKTRAKAVVKTCSDLKNILSEEQKEKVKELFKDLMQDKKERGFGKHFGRHHEKQ